ncbi:MAG: transporter [Hyphomicrobiales bacterium]|nr:LysE family translocator [Hyphomicrobiales bacterium]PCH50572.1 MAG: transporter [Hyphomicrobiales bacterium]
MVSLASILTIAIASAVVAIVPGPSVSLIIANSIRGSSRAGLLNIAGIQLGLILMILVVALGIEGVMTVMADWFFAIKLIGAAYLIYIGVKMLRSDGSFAQEKNVKPPKIGYFWQGFFVLIVNPKALLFFGAFIPQFIDTSGNVFIQSVVYGGVFMVVAGILDSMYAFLAGRAGSMISKNRILYAERSGGAMMVLGGLWMAGLSKN